MNIVIVGLGKIGFTLTKYLAEGNHDVTVIDSNAKVVESVVEDADVMGISGTGASYDVLMEAGAHKAKLFIAVTGSDEMNILSCLIAKKMGAEHTYSDTPGSIHGKSFLQSTEHPYCSNPGKCQREQPHQKKDELRCQLINQQQPVTVKDGKNNVIVGYVIRPVNGQTVLTIIQQIQRQTFIKPQIPGEIPECKAEKQGGKNINSTLFQQKLKQRDFLLLHVLFLELFHHQIPGTTRCSFAGVHRIRSGNPPGNIRKLR